MSTHFEPKEMAERFVRYASIYTQSKEGVPDTPSTPCQRDLAAVLARELTDMGASDVFYDEDGSVCAISPMRTARRFFM